MANEGNEFWKARSKHGRDKIFKTPTILWEAACEYFEWCAKNPFKEQKVFHTAGIITKTNVNKMRPYTQFGLCSFLHVTSSYFRAFKSTRKDSEVELDKDFITIIAEIDEIIYNQKYSGAAADLLNANIIARDLSLVDKTSSDNTNKIEYINVSKQFPEGEEKDELY